MIQWFVHYRDIFITCILCVFCCILLLLIVNLLKSPPKTAPLLTMECLRYCSLLLFQSVGICCNTRLYYTRQLADNHRYFGNVWILYIAKEKWKGCYVWETFYFHYAVNKIKTLPWICLWFSLYNVCVTCNYKSKYFSDEPTIWIHLVSAVHIIQLITVSLMHFLSGAGNTWDYGGYTVKKIYFSAMLQ